jgi:hypothetical protein
LDFISNTVHDKGKNVQLTVDGGSYCNGTSKVVVTTLGLSTWRIPEPKHVALLNSCGMMKVTHKVCVPFTVGDYVMRWSAMCCH